MLEPLTKDTVELYAAKVYLGLSKEDFDSDYWQFLIIKKSLTRWYSSKDTIHLARAINSIIIVINAFSTIGAARILFCKARPEQYPALKTLLLYIGHLPKDIPEVNLEMLKLDKEIVDILRKGDPRTQG